MEDVGIEVNAELYNNIGSLFLRMNKLTDSKKYLALALEKVKNEIESGTGRVS